MAVPDRVVLAAALVALSVALFARSSLASARRPLPDDASGMAIVMTTATELGLMTPARIAARRADDNAAGRDASALLVALDRYSLTDEQIAGVRFLMKGAI